MNLKNILTLILFVFTFCNITDIQAKTKTKKVKLESGAKVYVPKRVKQFKLKHVEKYEDANFGVSFSYANKNTPIGLTYYVYPVSEQIPLEFAMATEYDNTINEIKAKAIMDRNILSVLEVKILKFHNRDVIKTTMNMEIDNVFYISELYLASHEYHFLKMRATYPMSASKKFGLRKLNESVFEEVLLNTKLKPKKELKRSITIYADVLNSNEQDMKLAINYGINVVALVPNDLIISFDEYLEIYEMTLSLSDLPENILITDKEKKDLIGIVEINQAGFLKEFIWTVFYSPYWEKPNGLQLDKFKNWTNQFNKKTFEGRPIGVEVFISK